MEKKTITKEIFLSEDGKEFLSEDECKLYEENTLNRYKGIKYFYVFHSPDLTEGRGMYGKTFIAFENDCSYMANEYLNDWCFHLFGRAVEYVQGCSPIPNWSLHETTKEQWENRKNSKATVGDYSYDSKEIFISNKGDLEGYPKSRPLDYKNWKETKNDTRKTTE